jgi:hypothetical protein
MERMSSKRDVLQDNKVKGRNLSFFKLMGLQRESDDAEYPANEECLPTLLPFDGNIL